LGRNDHVNHCREIAIMSNRHRTNNARSSDALFAISYVPRPVETGKRIMDILIALSVLAITAPLWPLIALAIKLDSAGPVFYRQIRVGRAMADRTELFAIIKFRSMRADAEARTGAVLAQKRDPRITRVGAFLRKTRMDELPQLLNVLKGDMSMIGPRPERPSFYRRLDRVAPFFADRTMGLRPGITGLSQVCQGYDSSDADIIRKVGYDAAYSLHLTDMRTWVVSDLLISLRTLRVMVSGAGQ
jgi:lipopolysaccharide/colanic/teichoic acid biosynthesis glycosyltransferase